MEALTRASTPEAVYGATGLLMLLLGVVGAITLESWVMLFVAGLGAIFLWLAVAARRS